MDANNSFQTDSEVQCNDSTWNNSQELDAFDYSEASLIVTEDNQNVSAINVDDHDATLNQESTDLLENLDRELISLTEKINNVKVIIPSYFTFSLKAYNSFLFYIK